MSSFRWLEDLKKSGFFEDYEQRRFEANLEVIGDEKAKVFTVRLSWKDRMNQIGEIFIPAEGIKRMHSRIVKLEQEGFKEEMGLQVYPP